MTSFKFIMSSKFLKFLVSRVSSFLRVVCLYGEVLYLTSLKFLKVVRFSSLHFTSCQFSKSFIQKLHVSQIFKISKICKILGVVCFSSRKFLKLHF